MAGANTTPRFVQGQREVFDEVLALRRGLASSGGAGSVVVIAPMVPTPTSDADLLDGEHGAFYLSRSNHTGPWYTLYPIWNENAGLVVRGTVNGSLQRIYPYVADPAAPAPAAEAVASLVTGDVVLAIGGGPVLQGPYRGSYYRVLVRDDDPAAPQIQLELLTSAGVITAADMEFAQGFSWVQRSRWDGSRWLWRVYDEIGSGLDEARLFLERWAV
jgi:hypothetical protein